MRRGLCSENPTDTNSCLGKSLGRERQPHERLGAHTLSPATHPLIGMSVLGLGLVGKIDDDRRVVARARLIESLLALDERAGHAGSKGGGAQHEVDAHTGGSVLIENGSSGCSVPGAFRDSTGSSVAETSVVVITNLVVAVGIGLIGLALIRSGIRSRNKRGSEQT